MQRFQRPKIFICSMVLLLCTISAVSQKQVDHQNLLWTRYYLKLNINQHWSATQEFEERAYWFPWRQHQFVSRSLTQYQLGKGWNVGGGLTYFLQALPQDPYVKDYENQLELRPQLELAYKNNLSDNIVISHRYWSEFRYFQPKDEDLQFGNIRMRYKLEFQYQPIQKVTLKAYDEIFINIGSNIVHNVFDQNRIGASVQYMPLKNFGFELGYFNWFQQRPSGVDFYDRNIVRLTIYQNINFNKPKK